MSAGAAAGGPGSPAGVCLSLVVPCYNEAQNLPALLERFAAALKRPDVELVLVDNGSADRTAEVLDELAPAHPFVRVVRVSPNRGYGGGIMAGLEAGRGRFLGWTHADLQADPADALAGLELLESCPMPERTMAKGLRRGRPLAAAAFTWCMAAYASLRLGSALWDVNGQPVLFHRSLAAQWRGEPPSDFTFDLFALHAARSLEWSVLRFPVRFEARRAGHSSWDFGLGSKWRMAASVFRTCGRLARAGGETP